MSDAPDIPTETAEEGYALERGLVERVLDADTATEATGMESLHAPLHPAAIRNIPRVV